MKQHAAQPRRVIRDRRDDAYLAGHPAPGKRASAGSVTALQDDTVTVEANGELLTGVVFLGEQPPVGSVVEVEARGDLLTIPRWYEGPPDVVLLTTRLCPVGTIASLQGTVSGPVVFQPNNSAANLRDNSDATWARAFSTNGSNWSEMQFHLEPLPDGVLLADVVEVRYHIRYLFNRVSGTSTDRRFVVDLYPNDAAVVAGSSLRYVAGDYAGGAFPDNPPLGPSNTTIYDHVAPLMPRLWWTPADAAFWAPQFLAALQDNPVLNVAPFVTTGNTRQVTIYNLCVEVDHWGTP